MMTVNPWPNPKTFRLIKIGSDDRFGSRNLKTHVDAKRGLALIVCTPRKLRRRLPVICDLRTTAIQRSCESKVFCRATSGTPAGILHPKVPKGSIRSGFGFLVTKSKPLFTSSLIYRLIQIPIQFLAATSHPNLAVSGCTKGRGLPFSFPDFGTTKTAYALVFCAT